MTARPTAAADRSNIAAITPAAASHGAPSAGTTAAGSGVVFQYIGTTALTVVGPATGRQYRFTGASATLAVDPRDAPALATIPRLRRVR